MIAGHAEGFPALERPDGHAVGAFLRHADQTIDEVGHAVALEEGVHGMRGAIGVPQGEGAVVMGSGGETVNLAVHAPVLAINVIEESWCAQKVIKSSVENGFVPRVRGFD